MDIFSNINILELIITGIVVIISLTFHEFAHGFASYCLGDNTAKEEGRLTLNPFAHVDLFGLIMLFIIKFGWAKPVPINPSAYKNPRRGTVIVSFAGPLANFILAFLTTIVYSFLFIKTNTGINLGLNVFLITMIVLNINLGLFNLLPIPPLDGSKIVGGIFGGKIEEAIYKIEDKGMFILIILLFLPPFRNFLSIMSNFVLNGMFSITELFVF